tara:strand:+ start:1730 stop:2761 length:1032 start_codon:yes stop_codon:yes gene_type:complete
MNIIINATDVHSGGGKIMLDDILFASKGMEEYHFHIFIDTRYDNTNFKKSNINFYKISKLKRIFVDKKIKKIVENDSLIINIGDLPSFRKHQCTVIQFLMNRYFIDSFSKSGLPLIVKLRLNLAKLSFRIFLKNADYLFVQNNVMKDLLLKLKYQKDSIVVMPYKNFDKINSLLVEKEKNSFIYVASDEPHKNHLNLIKAWELLHDEELKPKLYLTINKNTNLFSDIKKRIVLKNLNITIMSNLDRNDLLLYYSKVDALVYPSLFECFGIPLVEAMNYNLPVIASELDYVRDILDPAESFDPNSPRSISRAIKRFLNYEEKQQKVIPADLFLNKIIKYAKKRK